MKERGFLLLSIFLSNLVLNCQAVTINRSPSSEHVIASEGEGVPIYCLTLNSDMSQAQTSWSIQKIGESIFTPLSFNGSTGEITSPSEYIGQFTAVGEVVQGFSPTRTFQTNFTLLNFTREFDLAQVLCGIRNPNEYFVYTIGLPGNLSMHQRINVHVILPHSSTIPASKWFYPNRRRG